MNSNETLSYRILIGIQLYYTPALVTLGSLGNSLSVIVFFSTKLKKLSSSYYLSALAISDTGFLLLSFPSWLSMFDNITLFNQPGFCEFSVYMTQVCSFLSVWFIVAFTVERFIAVRYPLKRPSMCTVSRAKAVLLGLSLFALLSYTPYIFISGVSQQNGTESEMCGPRRELMGLASTLNHVDVVVTLLIPFSAIVILNVLIARTVCKVARVRRSMTKTSGGSGLKSRTSSSQTKVTEMLLVVSTVFICLNLPSYVMRVLVYFSETSEQAEEQNVDMAILQQYFQLLFLTNFGINFALYCVSGQNFRKALVSIFRPDLLRRAETTQVTVVSEHCRTASTRRTVTVNGSWREIHELLPINKPSN